MKYISWISLLCIVGIAQAQAQEYTCQGGTYDNESGQCIIQKEKPKIRCRYTCDSFGCSRRCTADGERIPSTDDEIMQETDPDDFRYD